MNNNQAKRLETLALETEANKKKLVKALRGTPIAELACKKTGIGRSSYYKWRKQDIVFARACEQAMKFGESLINDVIESKLITLAQNSNLEAMKFWLKHNHNKYAVTSRDINVFNLASQLPSIEELSESKRILSMNTVSEIGSKMRNNFGKKSKSEIMIDLEINEAIISSKMEDYVNEE
jgi:ACT domain-containing protein